jgi:UDP-glucose 4-epimerase
MKVLITGGLGFIGLHLAKALTPMCSCLDLLDIQDLNNIDGEASILLQKSNVKYIKKSLLHLEDSLDGDYDYIFHLAALLGVENVSLNPFDVLYQNAFSSFNIIEQAIKQKNLKKIFFTSTSEVYAGTLTSYGLDFPTKETTPLTISPLEMSRTSYMLSKIYGEGLFNASKLPFIILRPHNIYGPRMGMRHVIPQLIHKALMAKDELEVFSPFHTRTFCFIDDAVQYIINLINSETVNQTFNLGVESPEITIKELAENICQIIGKNLTIKEMPETQGSPSRRVPSMKRLQQITQYQPQVSLTEGIDKTYRWYRSHFFAEGI